MLPDNNNSWASGDFIWSQCTYRCVVLPDQKGRGCLAQPQTSLNVPTGAWCSLTGDFIVACLAAEASQCTYRCVVLPDAERYSEIARQAVSLNAPTGAWCSLTDHRYS